MTEGAEARAMQTDREGRGAQTALCVYIYIYCLYTVYILYRLSLIIIMARRTWYGVKETLGLLAEGWSIYIYIYIPLFGAD